MIRVYYSQLYHILVPLPITAIDAIFSSLVFVLLAQSVLVRVSVRWSSRLQQRETPCRVTKTDVISAIMWLHCHC